MRPANRDVAAAAEPSGVGTDARCGKGDERVTLHHWFVLVVDRLGAEHSRVRAGRQEMTKNSPAAIRRNKRWLGGLVVRETMTDATLFVHASQGDGLRPA